MATKKTPEIIRAEADAVMRFAADQWWAWHDADAERWSAEHDDAESRCAAWVAGQSDDGPSD